MPDKHQHIQGPGSPGPNAVRSSDSAWEERVAEVDAVLFDLDGTLIDTLDLIRESMRYATNVVLGAPLPDEVLMHNVGIPLIHQLREFDAERAEEMLAVYREHNWKVHDTLVREYPGVEEALDRLLDHGYRLGIVTSKARTVAMRGLERFSLERFFDVIVTYDDVDRFKPDPYPLVYAAESLGLAPGACAYVGDSPHDISAANAAGCLSVAAVWGVAGAERLMAEDPDTVAETMKELIGLFPRREPV